MIDLDQVGLRVGDRWLIRGLSTTMLRGSTTAVLGPSGVGKTTLLGAVAGFVETAEGAIAVTAGASISWSQQNSPVFARRSALDNVMLGAECHGVAEAVARSRGLDALERMGLGGRVGTRAGKLSGGERQRLALARAVVGHADVVLVDEPTASLGNTDKGLVISAMLEVALLGACVIVATHDAAVAHACDATVDLSTYAGDRV